jgi:hypothetical protein
MFYPKFIVMTMLCLLAAFGLWALLGAVSVILWSAGCFGLGTMFGMAVGKIK